MAKKTASKPACQPDETPLPDNVVKGKRKGWTHCDKCKHSTKGTKNSHCKKPGCGAEFTKKQKSNGTNQNARRKQSDAIEAIRTVKEIRGLIEEMGGEDEIRTMLARLQPLANRCDGFENIEQVLNDW